MAWRVWLTEILETFRRVFCFRKSRINENSGNVVSHDKPQYTITTAASLLGWGAVPDGISTGGNWTYDESLHHINYLEMYAILVALKTFANDKSNTHMTIMTDNSTAVSAINHMGTSHSHPCNFMAKEIWEWCLERNIWISVAHIRGTQNFAADFESRRNQKEAEWMLTTSSLQDALKELDFTPEIDLRHLSIPSFQSMCLLNPIHPPLP